MSIRWAKQSGEDAVGKWCLYRNDIGDYMQRWILQTPWGTFRLHHILRSDEARALHDHPWDFTSILLTGGYDEILPRADGSEYCVHHPRWSVVRHAAEDQHRLIVHRPVWTLVWTGPLKRKWGFQIPGQGWTYWRDALACWAGGAR